VSHGSADAQIAGVGAVAELAGDTSRATSWPAVGACLTVGAGLAAGAGATGADALRCWLCCRADFWRFCATTDCNANSDDDNIRPVAILVL
jgi:hypothetical protein